MMCTLSNMKYHVDVEFIPYTSSKVHRTLHKCPNLINHTFFVKFQISYFNIKDENSVNGGKSILVVCSSSSLYWESIDKTTQVMLELIIDMDNFQKRTQIVAKFQIPVSLTLFLMHCGRTLKIRGVANVLGHVIYSQVRQGQINYSKQRYIWQSLRLSSIKKWQEKKWITKIIHVQCCVIISRL